MIKILFHTLPVFLIKSWRGEFGRTEGMRIADYIVTALALSPYLLILAAIIAAIYWLT